jgi:hypothetical protein
MQCGAARRRSVNALQIALEAGNHSIALLLLSNGFQPDLAADSPLDIALRARRWDLVDLLLEWDADPQRVDRAELFGTYRLELFQRFWDLGVDLTDHHAMARYLIEHQGAKPLFGFAKRHRSDPRIQRELDVALAYHAGEGNEKGTSLCLWAGADPHTPACHLRYGNRCVHMLPVEEQENDEDHDPFWNAIDEACRAGHVAILERLKPDPALDDFDELYGWARHRHVIDYLLEIAPPKDPNRVLEHHLWRIGWFDNHWRALDPLRVLFEAGLRWTNRSGEAAAGLRRVLLKLSDEMFTEVVALLSTSDYCDPQILAEIARTPAMRKRFKELGYLGTDDEEPTRSRRHRYRVRPTHARQVVTRFGVTPQKTRKPTRTAAPATPRAWSMRIGRRHRAGEDLELDRAALFERVWSVPVATLAAEWGLSGPGLKKACARFGVPVPPRGYWARLRAGQHPRRPRLPTPPPDAPSSLVVSIPPRD